VTLSELRDRVTVGTLRWAPTAAYSTLIGVGARRSIPRPLRAPLYRAFARAVGARLDEVEAPLPDYPSFGDFFARHLVDGARPVDDAPLVSPCDGAVGACGVVDRGTLVQAKGHDYRLEDLVVDGALARALDGGQFATIYLSPRDYHRVHAPAAGAVTRYHYVPGRRWPVSPRYVENVERLFAVNERVVIEQSSPWGPIAIVMVSATGVGNIWLTHAGHDSRRWRAQGELRHVAVDAPVAAGDEVGAFLLGSTVVLVLPPGAPALVLPAAGAAMRCGAAIARGAA
jgi:phosphatidylserine decarboxylase